MKKQFIFLSLFFFLFTSPVVAKESFPFDKDMQNWRAWGSGSAIHNAGLGHDHPGSIELSCNKGEDITFYQKFTLPPGKYMLTAWLRAFAVQAGQWNQSIWLFYQTEGKIVSPVMDLKGTFDWSRVQYSFIVEKKPAQIWFRLKAAGMLWIDDLSIEPYSGAPIAFRLEKSQTPFPEGNPIGRGVRCNNCYRWMPEMAPHCFVCGHKLPPEQRKGNAQEEKPVKAVLMDFEEEATIKEKSRHPFQKFSSVAASGGRSAVIAAGEFQNFRLGDKVMNDWSGYDYLALDVYNPTHKQVKFAICIGDKKASSYWDQLNHYTTLAHGWNHLQFTVNRYVGERGSVKIKRYLKLKNIRTLWCKIDAKQGEEQFLVDNIRLLRAPKLRPPSKNFLLFDFVKDDFRTARGFTGVETRHRYSPDVGFGFVDAEIWRPHDSIYADTLLRDGIFINKGQFRVDVPNGKYVVWLVPNALGEWFEHFWLRRKITIQNKVVLQEKRISVQDYEKNFLRFSRIEPKPEDDAYDLYLDSVFAPIETEVTVDDGKIVIDCEGDASAILLNALVIFPSSQKEKGRKFLTRLHDQNKEEFQHLCRRVESEPQIDDGAISPADESRGFYSALIDSDVQLRYNQVLKTSGEVISLHGGRGQHPVQALMVRNLGDKDSISLTISTLKTADGKELQPQPDWLRYGVNQFQSKNINHETYELAPRFLRRFPKKGMALEKDFSRLIWLQIPIKKGTPAGIYSGNLNITMHGQKKTYPVEVEVEDFDLPEADLAVGFFGLDPVHCNYLELPGVEKLKKKNRLAVLKALRERGFTTWTSLPNASFVKKDGSWTLESDEIDWLMNKAKGLGFSQKIFTYSGKFPVVLDKNGTIDGVAEPEYRMKTAAILKQHIKQKGWLPVVFDISDEATGYSQTVKRDVKRVEMLENYFPFLLRGGYSHPIEQGKPGYELNEQFTDISFSSITPQVANRYKKSGKRWGLYNQAIGLFDNNRKSFGADLIKARKMGCDHLLGWALTLAANYPYYDLDGRENDAMMFFPRLDGGFDYALKFEWAAQGLEEYRLNLYKNSHDVTQ